MSNNFLAGVKAYTKHTGVLEHVLLTKRAFWDAMKSGWNKLTPDARNSLIGTAIGGGIGAIGGGLIGGRKGALIGGLGGAGIGAGIGYGLPQPTTKPSAIQPEVTSDPILAAKRRADDAIIRYRSGDPRRVKAQQEYESMLVS